MTNVVPALRPQAPVPTTFAEMEKLAEYVARSGMFGVRTKEQAFVLMELSRAEGRSPVLACRDYNIISGKPAKTSEAMHRDLIAAGGKLEWHELSDTVADATFSHPASGTMRIRWDRDRVKLAGLEGREGHRKYPRSMLRARCISEGVRTVCPMATSGLYVPEEVADFTPHELREPAPEPESVVAELDSFAEDAVRLGAEVASTRGRDAFIAFYRPLGPAERAILATDMDTYKRVAAEADERLAEADPFDAIPVEPAPDVDSSDLPRSEIWDDPEYTVTLGESEAGPAWKEWSDRVGYLASEAATIDELDKLVRDNREMLSRARRESGDDWRHIQDKVEARRTGLGG